MNTEQGFLTPVQAAERLGTTTAALAQLRRRHVGPRWKSQNGRILYRAADLFIESTSDIAHVEPLLTAQQVATLLAMSTSALTHLRARGEGPSWVAIGRSIRYRPEDLRQYLDAHTTPGIQR